MESAANLLGVVDSESLCWSRFGVQYDNRMASVDRTVLCGIGRVLIKRFCHLLAYKVARVRRIAIMIFSIF